MKVQLFVSKDLEESHAEIYTDILTDNIQKAMVLLEDEDLEGNIDGIYFSCKKRQGYCYFGI